MPQQLLLLPPKLLLSVDLPTILLQQRGKMLKLPAPLRNMSIENLLLVMLRFIHI